MEVKAAERAITEEHISYVTGMDQNFVPFVYIQLGSFRGSKAFWQLSDEQVQIGELILSDRIFSLLKKHQEICCKYDYTYIMNMFNWEPGHLGHT